MDNRKELVEKIIDELNGRRGFDDCFCGVNEYDGEYSVSWAKDLFKPLKGKITIEQ